MKRFDTIGEYMFDLLFAPLQRGVKKVNQFYIFLKVVGRMFDGTMEDIFRVRREANIKTASPVMLQVHGQDRDMPQLPGETVEGYRQRLLMKGTISEWGGTKTGILYALAALGYERSTIERFSLQDPERWAEFIVFLSGSQQNGVNDLDVIDAQVRKVKEGSSRPAYGARTAGVIEIQSRVKKGLSRYPRCGEIVCGVWPYRTSTGHLERSLIEIGEASSMGDVPFPRVGTVAASEKCYQPYTFAEIKPFASQLVAASGDRLGVRPYPVCSPGVRCSEGTYTTNGG